MTDETPKHTETETAAETAAETRTDATSDAATDAPVDATGEATADAMAAGAKAHPDDAKANPDDAKAHPDDAKAHPDGAKAHPDDAKANPDDAKANPDDAKANPDDAKANPDDAKANPDDAKARSRSRAGAAKPGRKPAPPADVGPDAWDTVGAWLGEARCAARARADHDRGRRDPLAHLRRRARRRRPDVPLRGERSASRTACATSISTCGIRARTPATRPRTTTRSCRSSMSAVPAALFGHLPFLFSLSVVLPLVLAPACAYRGMRLIGATPWQSAIAAFVIAFMNGQSRWGAGNAGTFQVGLYTQTWALCLFPLALGHGARWIRDRKGLAPAIAWGGASFLCHPFAGISLGVALVVAFLVKFAVTWRLWRSPTMLGVIALYLGGGPLIVFGALVILPVGPEVPAAAVVACAALAALGGGLVWKFRASDRMWRDPSVQTIARRAPPARDPRLAADGHDRAGAAAAGVRSRGLRRLPAPRRRRDRARLRRALLLVHERLDPRLQPEGPPPPAAAADVRPAADPGVHDRGPRRVTALAVAPAILYALWLGLGPHAGKVGDDLLPAVRALGAMQTVIALGIGAGA